MKLSIILPVYNVEPYLERCIRSLEDQVLPQSEYEIIVVNDGSPDNSRLVVIRLQQEFTNIILIDQENKGVSLARNAGMEQAQGDYLLFIDPDDYVLPNTLPGLLAQAYALQADVSFLGYYFLDVEGHRVAEVLHTSYRNKVYPGIEAYMLSRGDGKTDPDRSWAILYKKEFMNMYVLRYVPQIPYLEDGEFIARVLCLAERCAFSGSEFYMRTTRPGSATNSDLFFQDRAAEGFIKAAKNLKLFQAQPFLSKTQKNFLNQPICKFILLTLIPSCSLLKWNRFQAWTRILRKESLGSCEIDNCIIYYRIEGWLYNASPQLLFFHRLFRMPLFWFIRC